MYPQITLKITRILLIGRIIISIPIDNIIKKRQPIQNGQVGVFLFYFFTILESETLPFNGSFDFGLIGSPKYFFKKSFIIIISILLVTLNYIQSDWIDLTNILLKWR